MPCGSKQCANTVGLVGKTALITGCNTGIGKETVKDFYMRGSVDGRFSLRFDSKVEKIDTEKCYKCERAKVIMACRNVDKAEEAKQSIIDQCKDIKGTGRLLVIKCDLTSLESVRECAQKILDTEPELNILVNNAGVFMTPEGKTKDGFETQFGTNHLAHFLLTLLLLPRIRNSTPARIVTVSSSAHSFNSSGLPLDDINYTKRSYSSMDAYVQSKLANILFSKELASKFEEYNISGVNTYSLHPGVIKTEITRNINGLWNTLLYPFQKTPLQGAQTTIYCSVDEKCANETGLYYSESAVEKPSKPARDGEAAKKLWDYSVGAVKLGDFNPFTATDSGVKNK